MKKFYKSKRYRKLKAKRTNKKIYRVARRAAMGVKEWKMAFQASQHNYSSATGTCSQLTFEHVKNIAQGDQRWADVTAATGALRDGNAIIGKASFMRIKGYLNYNGLANNQTWWIRCVVWEPKNGVDMDDVYTYMTGTGAGTPIGQTTAGNPQTLNMVYFNPDMVRVHYDRMTWIMNNTGQSKQFFSFKKMIKFRRFNKFAFTGNASVVPRNRQIYTSLYIMADPAATAQYIYWSQFHKLYFKDS